MDTNNLITFRCVRYVVYHIHYKYYFNKATFQEKNIYASYHKQS